MGLTHCERVLALLSDHKPHSHREGYALRVMFHSRVADLRRQGHDIACWREGDLYLYRLVPLDEAAVGPAASSSGADLGQTAGAEQVAPLEHSGASAAAADAPESLDLEGRAYDLDRARAWTAYYQAGLPWTAELEDAVNRGEVDVG